MDSRSRSSPTQASPSNRGPDRRRAGFVLRLFRLAGAVVGAWIADGGASMSAAVAFFAAFSLAPVLVVAIAVASLFVGVEAVQGRLFSGIEAVVGGEGAAIVQAMVASAWKAGGGGWTGGLSLAGTAIGATATFVELNRALNTIWNVPQDPHMVASILRVRLVSFGLAIGTGFLVVVLLIADAALAYGSHWLFGAVGIALALNLLEQALSFAFLCLAFSLLLKLLPDAPVPWRAAAVGGIATAVLFSLGKQLFASYLAYAGTANAFGAAGSLAVLMMWLFFSAAVFLLGAEVAAFFGSRKGDRNYTAL
jgi:membrane protein